MSFTIKRNDTRPELVATLRNSTGEPVDLTDAQVKFIMTDRMGRVIVSKPCVVTAPAEGKLEYRWAPEDTQTHGGYRGEFEITFLDGSVLTVPTSSYISINIVADLG